MNVLLSYYLDKNSMPKWKDKFSSAAQSLIMYKFKGTNGRYLTSYEERFRRLSEVEGCPRTEWPTYEKNGQQIHKQYTVPMIEAKLFYKQNDAFYKTEKGKIYEQYLELELKEKERWIINYLLLLDSTILKKENYIINRSLEVNDMLVSASSKEFVENSATEFFDKLESIKTYEDIGKYDYTYLNCMYLDKEFINLYYNSSKEDREEFKEYVTDNLRNKNKNCCISKKFVSTNYSVPELKDDALIYCYSMLIKDIKFSNYENTIKAILDVFRSKGEFDKGAVYQFVFKNRRIFEPILINVFNVEETNEDYYANAQNKILPEIQNTSDRPEPRIDDTTIEGKQQLQTIYNYRKQIAREVSSYKCELELYKGCRYFTSKKTNENYVEVHHFVPRQFRNEFEYSVDVLANYITLCPHCHRMIHLATDRERIDAIQYIYNQRKKRLDKCGIHVELDDIFEFYNIETK